ncbi:MULTISPECIES: DNA methyltransferase [Burkholderiaceae]|uniref:DNA methyltransferase n=1 Tax=Burkholderiaceae TaxID=119060 RepID=UPI000DB8DCAF|nr:MULTISPECIES: DNA methyltransferase [Burkholderiaceae]PZR41185.1 MAG: DNA methylase [Paraburkholderia fungorum]
MGRMILGDCLSVMPSIPAESIDLIVTDPPYLVNFTDRSGRSITNDKTDEWLAPAFAEMHRIMRRNTICVSFYGWTKVDRFFDAWKQAGFRVVGHLVFAKSYASKARYVRYQHESAFLLAKGNPPMPADPLPDVLPWEYSGNRLHPTQKPVSALARIIEAFSEPHAIVLDPFAGSGSTCEAAHRVGRRYVGIEIDETYHANAMRRLRALTLRAAA